MFRMEYQFQLRLRPVSKSMYSPEPRCGWRPSQTALRLRVRDAARPASVRGRNFITSCIVFNTKTSTSLNGLEFTVYTRTDSRRTVARRYSTHRDAIEFDILTPSFYPVEYVYLSTPQLAIAPHPHQEFRIVVARRLQCGQSFQRTYYDSET